MGEEYRSGDLSNTAQMSNDPATAATGNRKGINQIDVYQLVKDAYNGTGGFRSGGYLVEHTRERDFVERCSYSYYLNYFRPILDSLVNPVFKQPPERKGDNQEFQIFETDCDRSGTDLTNFMKKVAKAAKRDGVTFVVMDNDSQQPVSIAEAREQRSIPYIYIKEANKVIQYSMTQFGELISITFKETAGDVESGKTVKYQYRQWLRGEWKVFKKFEDGELKEQIDGGLVPGEVLSVVPVYTSDPVENEVLPHPPLYDIARLNAAIFNVCSELREVQRKQGFSILALPKQGDSAKAQEIGTTSALAFPAEARHAPHFIQPDVEIQKGYMDERDKLTEEIYKQAKLAGVSGVVEQSGIAKQWDFEGTDIELNQLARELEATEKAIVKLFKIWQNVEFDFEISYPEDFGILDIDADIERADGFIALGMTPEIVTEAKKEVTKGYFKSFDPDKRDELTDTLTVEGETQKQVDAMDEAVDDENSENEE